MNVVDSSAWLEYFSGGPNADYFADAIEQTDELIVPTITLYEVLKKIILQRGEDVALQAIAVMHSGRFIDLDASIATRAAKISVEYRLPMADSVILATTWTVGGTLWTQDADFEGIDGVRYRAHSI
jgi:toxin FitB